MSIYAGNKKIAGLYRGEDVEHATEIHAGIIEIATTEETNEGTDNLKAITPLKLKGKIDINNLQQDKKIEEIQEEFNSFTPTLIGEGTDIELKDTIKARFKKINITGNSEQETREGYNLLDLVRKGEVTLNFTSAYKTADLITNRNTVLEPGTYTLALKIKSNNGQRFNKVTLTGPGGEVKSYSPYVTVPTEFTQYVYSPFTLTETKEISIVRMQNAGNPEVFTFKDIMIVEGSYTKDTIPDFEDYGVMPSTEFKSEVKTIKDNINIKIENEDKTQEQNLIMPIQLEMLEGDYFDWDNKEEVHIWKKYEFNGTERIEITTSGYFKLMNISDYDVGNIDISYSNYYKFNCQALLASQIPYKDNTISFSTNTATNFQYVWVIDSRFTTIDEFKVWLKQQYDNGVPFVLYYKLLEPIKLPFTEEQKTAYTDLKKLKTYEETTYISSPDEIKPILNIEAVMKIEKKLEEFVDEKITRIIGGAY